MNAQIPARTIVTPTRRARTLRAVSLVPAKMVTPAMEKRAQTWMNVQKKARTVVTPTRRARTLQALSLAHATLASLATARHVVGTQ